MNVRVRSRRCILLACGCAIGLLFASCRPTSEHPESPAALARATEYRAAISSRRAAGDLSGALALAREQQRVANSERDTPAWRRDDAERQVRTLSRIASLPSAARAEFARADAMALAADSLLAGGDAAAAAAALSASLTISVRWLGDDHEDCARIRSALARASFARGDVPHAIKLDRQALRARRQRLGARHPEVAESLDQLAVDLKTAGGDRDEPLRLYREALALRRALLGVGASPTIETQLHLGNLHRARHEPDSALAVFQRVLALEHGTHTLGDERMAATLFSMAMTVTPLGEWERAEPWLRGATERWRALGPSARQSLARSLGAQGLTLRHLGRNAEAEEALAESIQLFEDLRRETRPGTASAVSIPLVSYDLLAAVQLERGRGAEAWRSLERGLARGLLEELARKRAIDTTGWWHDALPRVQRSLPDDAALIGWLTTRPGAAREEYPFWAYCIRSQGRVRWWRVDGPAAGAAADGDLDRIRRELVRAASWPLRVKEDAVIREWERAAYDLRMAPLEPGLRGVHRLIVVSPDLLHGTPVESLMDSSMTPLAERFVISYAPSALLYAASQQNRSARQTRRPWRALLAGDAGPASGRDALPALAAAHREIRELSARLLTPTVIFGQDAAAKLDRMASAGELAEYSLIHFATHAAIKETWLGESALVLARDTTGAPGSGLITARQIAQHWRLDADLVTLAGCETLVGPAASNEGFQGLQHAFLCAGARHLLVSAWRVDDDATALLMSRFYERLLAAPGDDGGSREAEALADAQRWLRAWRASDGSRPYAHPAYWAGFVLVEGGAAAPSRPSAAATLVR